MFGQWKLLKQILDTLQEILKVDLEILAELRGPQIKSGVLKKGEEKNG